MDTHRPNLARGAETCVSRLRELAPLLADARAFLERTLDDDRIIVVLNLDTPDGMAVARMIDANVTPPPIKDDIDRMLVGTVRRPPLVDLLARSKSQNLPALVAAYGRNAVLIVDGGVFGVFDVADFAPDWAKALAIGPDAN